MMRTLRRRAALVLLLGVLLVAPGAQAQLSFLGLKNNLVHFVLDQISVPGEFEVSAEGVEEPDDGSTTLVGLTIADADGVWLRVGSVALNWSPARVLRGEIEIQRLAAADVEYLRAPGASVEVKEDADIAEDDDEPFDWPRAPLAVIVEELRLDRVRIAPGAVAEQGLAFDAVGAARDEGDEQSLRLDLTRTDAVEGRIRIDYLRGFEANTLSLELEADEAAGGLVAEFAGLPEESASRVRLTAAGPLTDWQVSLIAASDEVIDVQGALRVALDKPISVQADLAARPGPKLNPTAQKLLAPEAVFDLAVREGEDGVIRIERGHLTSPEISLTSSGLYDEATGAVDLEIDLNAEPGLVADAEGFSFADIAFVGRVKGTVENLDGSGRIAVAGLTSEAVDIGEGVLEARVAIAGERIGFGLDGGLTGFRVDALSAELLGDTVIDGDGAFEAGVLTLERLNLDSPLLTLRADGQADTGAETLAFAYRLAAERLRPIAEAYETDAEGAFALEGRLSGGFDAPRLEGGAAFSDLALEGERYGAVRLTHDARFGAEPAGRVALTADGSRYGPAELSTDFRLAGDDLALSNLLATALDARAEGAFAVDLGTTLADGSLRLSVPSLDRTRTALGLDIAGRAEGDVRLATVSVPAAFGTTERQQSAELDFEIAAFEGFEARVERVGLTGQLGDLLGEPGGTIVLELGATEHPQARLAGGEVTATLANLTRRGSVDLDYRLEAVEAPGAARFEELAGTARLTDLEGEGAGRVDATVTGIAAEDATVREVVLGADIAALLASPDVDATLRAVDIAAAGYAVATVEAEAAATDLTGAPAAKGTLRARDIAGPDAAVAEARVEFDLTDLTGAPGGAVTAVVEEIAAAGFTVARVDAESALSDLTGSPAVTLTARTGRIAGAGIAAEQATLEADLADLTGTGGGTVSAALSGLSGEAQASAVTLEADMTGLTVPAGTVAVRTQGLGAGGAQIGAVRLDATLTDRQGKSDIRATLAVPEVAAEGARVEAVALVADIRDALGAPTLDLRLDADRVAAGDIALEAPRFTATGPLSRLALVLDADGTMDRKVLAARLRAVADLAGAGPEAQVDTLELTLDEARIGLDSPLRVRSSGGATRIEAIDLALPGGGLSGTATLYSGGASGDLALDMQDLAALKTLSEDIPVARGRFALAAAFDTRQGRARAEVTGEGRGLGFDGVVTDIGDLGLDLDAGWNGRRLTGETALSGPFGDPVRATVGLAMLPSGGPAPRIPENGALEAAVRWQGDLGRLWALVPLPDHVLHGDLDLDAQVGGTLAAPQPGGSVTLRQGQYQNLDTGTILTGLTMDSSLGQDGSVTLALDGRDGASGTVAVEVRLEGETLDATVTARNAVLVRRDDVTAQISTDIKAEGPLTALALSGTTVIDRAEVRLVNALPPSVADLGPVRIKGEPVPEPGDAAGSAITLDLRVQAERNVFVRGRGLDTEWQVGLDIGGTAARPRVVGAIERVRGQLDLLGKTFDMEAGEITFTGGREIDPRLNIAMAHENDGVTGYVRVTGTASQPEIGFDSEPALPEDEVLPRTVFGKSSQSLSAGEALQLAGAVATLLDGSGGALDSIRGAAGIDVLRVDTGGDDGPSVTVGKNVADGVFVGATQPIDGGDTKVQVEVEVFDNVTVDGEFGGDGESSLGVNWRKDF